MSPEIQLPEKVKDIAAQKAIIRGTTNYSDYAQFRAYLFDHEDVIWRGVVRDELLHTTDATPDRYRMLGFTGVLANGFGYEFLEGHKIFLCRKGTIKPLTSVRHQLALASFVGGLNEQVYSRKERIAQEMERLEPGCEEQFGAWGILFPHSKHTAYSRSTMEENIVDAVRRYNDVRDICLPNREVNRTLASLRFTPKDADEMTDYDFMRTVYPKIEKTFGEYLDDPAEAFGIRSVGKMNRFYSAVK